MRRTLVLAALLVLAAPVATWAAQNPLAPSQHYNPAIPTVESVLGHQVGEAFTPYDGLERYYQRLSSASDRVRLLPYGKSVEGRTLYLVVISAPENLAHVSDIRATAAKLADPRRTTAAEAQQLAESTPVIVWLSYNVHGNEAVSSEAALQVAYELAASEDEGVRTWLAHAVVLLDPVVNPDGRERYVQYYNTTVGAHPNPDRFAVEHSERWPGGRTNHYLFDLNRDWAWQIQPESAARVAAYRQWNPQVHIDYHEMGPDETYFFPPPKKPVLEFIAPLLDKWFALYGQGNAAAFDRYALPYYTHEDFDLFYPSYGDTWPALNGAVGMTYEQGGGGRAGLTIDLAEGQGTLTLRDRVVGHFVSSLATIATSVAHRQERLHDFYAFHRAALNAAGSDSVQTFLLAPGPDPDRLNHVVAMLLRQGIEVQQAQGDFTANDVSDYWGDRWRRKSLPAGTYVVDLSQPAGFLARAELEKEAKLSEPFFYDVTGWSLPLAAGLDAYAAGKAPSVGLNPVTEPPVAVGGVTGDAAQAVAYIFSWEPTAAVRLLAHLQQENFKTYVSLEPFRLNGRAFAAGSIVVPVRGNPPALAERLPALAEQDHCRVYAEPTMRSEEGVDLGSDHVRFLRPARVAVLTDTPVSPTGYGALWFLFEQRFHLPFTALRTESLGGVDLSQYNVLLLPPDFGDGRGYGRALNEGLTKKITEWVAKGGVLIALRGGAVFAASKKVELASVGVHFVRREDEEAREPDETEAAPGGEKPAGQPEKDERLLTLAERAQQQREEEIPGTILRVTLDPTHPLAFGLGERAAVLDETAPILDLTTVGENVAYFPDANLKLSGWLTPENESKLAHTAYLLRESHGKGQVILFADSPVFRGFWDGSARLLLNAVFFGQVTDPDLE